MQLSAWLCCERRVLASREGFALTTLLPLFFSNNHLLACPCVFVFQRCNMRFDHTTRTIRMRSVIEMASSHVEN
jgi:hypothetical protein